MTNEQMTAVEKALKRAYSLGQTYWQQADSEYTSDHKKSALTQARFNELLRDTLAACASPPPPALSFETWLSGIADEMKAATDAIKKGELPR